MCFMQSCRMHSTTPQTMADNIKSLVLLVYFLQWDNYITSTAQHNPPFIALAGLQCPSLSGPLKHTQKNQ